MRVIAAEHPVPRAPTDTERRSIQPTPAKSVEVADISYYRRRVASGELLLVVDESPVTAVSTKSSPRRSAKSTTKGGEQ